MRKQLTLKTLIMNYLKTLIFTLILFATAFSCTQDEDSDEIQTSDLLYKGLGILETGINEMPIILQHENGERIVTIDTNGDSYVDGLIYTNGSDFMNVVIDEYTLLPNRITTSDNTVFLFAFKQNNTLVDIGVLKQDNQVNYIRDIAIVIPERAPTRNPGEALQAASVAISAVGIAIGTVTCITAGTGLIVSTAGFAIPIALATCSSLIINAITLINENSDNQNIVINQLGSANNIYSYIADTMGCQSGDPVACYSLILGGIGGIIDQTQNILNTIGEQNIAIAEGALFSGFGVIKVTLVWDTTSDIDLWVTDPTGEQIDYTNTTSQSGGYLDVDDVDGFGPENIFWASTAPLGNYMVQAHYYESNGQGSTNYTIQVQYGDLIETFSGTLATQDDLASVTSFNYSGRQSNLIFSELNTISRAERITVKNHVK
ncbi:MAG: hypothetical protein ACJA1Z_000510 [Patiriisocius sp.]|jgi:hypothetical protein